MTSQLLERLPVYMTSSISRAMMDADTNAYILSCLESFYAGNYGEIPFEDIQQNNADLIAGEGHVLARYKAKHNLVSDIYIESHFCGVSGNDYNNTVICYCSER